MKRKSRAVPRFAIGEHVRTKDTIASRFIGREGKIILVKRNAHVRPSDTTLDKYTVVFTEDGQADFFDIQLVKAK